MFNTALPSGLQINVQPNSQSLTKLAVKGGRDEQVFSDRRVFVGNLPKLLHRDQLKHELIRLVPTVDTVTIYSDPHDQSFNRGFAFLDFCSTEDATEAINLLRKTMVLGLKPKVAWAEVENMVSERIMQEVKKLFIRGIPLNTKEPDFAAFLGGSTAGITKVRIQQSYAFVHFVTRETAEIVRKAVDGVVYNGNELAVEWAKPASEKVERNCSQQASDESCIFPDSLLLPAAVTADATSLPPKILIPQLSSSRMLSSFALAPPSSAGPQNNSMCLPSLPSYPQPMWNLVATSGNMAYFPLGTAVSTLYISALTHNVIPPVYTTFLCLDSNTSFFYITSVRFAGLETSCISRDVVAAIQGAAQQMLSSTSR